MFRKIGVAGWHFLVKCFGRAFAEQGIVRFDRPFLMDRARPENLKSGQVMSRKSRLG
jgi:hypothetical protein